MESIKDLPEYAGRFNEGITYITGYSGGGGNTLSALTKFPDYWNAGASFVGISDYGFAEPDGWYFNGAGGRTRILDEDIGVRTSNDPDVIDRYHARASNLASKNNPYSEIYLFANDNESISPNINNTSFRDNAIVAESFPGEFDNITFINGQSGVEYQGPGNPIDWVDWNNDGIQQSDELQNFPHSTALAVQERGERWFLDDLLAGDIQQPVLNDSDELYVAGFVRTRPFQVFLGDGQNAAADLFYSLDSDELVFELDIASLNKAITGELTIYENRLSTSQALIELNGTIIGQTELFDGYVYEGLSDGDRLRFLAVPEAATIGLICTGGVSLMCYRPRRTTRCSQRCMCSHSRFKRVRRCFRHR